MSSEGLEKLVVWRKAKEFAVLACSQLIPMLPAEEKWVMSQQIRRAAQSIPANIAEGYGRFYYLETIRFCYIASGSLEETISHVMLAFELGYLSEAAYKKAITSADELAKLLNGYIAYLKRSKQGENEPGFHSIHEPFNEYESIDKFIEEIPTSDENKT